MKTLGISLLVLLFAGSLQAGETSKSATCSGDGTQLYAKNMASPVPETDVGRKMITLPNGSRAWCSGRCNLGASMRPRYCSDSANCTGCANCYLEDIAAVPPAQ